MSSGISKRRKIDIKCQYCDKTYSKPSKVAEHERSHTGERPFICTHEGCDKAYFRSSHLVVHQRSHSNDKDFICSFDNCTAAFATKQHLQRHEKSHTTTINCDFPGCHAEYSKRCQLRRHKMTHEVGTHTCPTCKSVFDSSLQLEKHIDRVHINPVVYKCGTCTETFNKWSTLRKHMMTEHPFKCSVCKKAYGKKYNLKQHIKEKHMNMGVVTCDWPGCGADLKTKRGLKTHVALVHEQDIRYKCDVCSKGFPYMSMLERHKGSHTPKTLKPSPRIRHKSIVEQLTGFNHYSDKETLGCPFEGCHFKFTNSYLLRRHIEGKNHKSDVRLFADTPSDPTVASPPLGFEPQSTDNHDLII
ncbi:hypothetical protein INT47_011551 [Mucor saturninus]|uniref:C2H2-type domain-containing protein n=1 Tax=Mucor saturninus TaxID=64648 RepID=A0A8H7QVB7_9FUNG|nr:hypothetical protein INT47_011551 [Mucor saturninus]